MIQANAIVDVITQPPSGGKKMGVFRVEVWGRSPHDYVRIYEIRARDDNMAAREGLDRFCTEIEKLLKQQEN